MKNKISLIIPSYKRSHLLSLGLWSISQYNYNTDFEILVLNDGIKDDTENICKKYKDKLNIRYFFTGHRNINKENFRVPSFAYNIGIKQSKNNIIILTSPEMFHLNNIIDPVAKSFSINKKILSTPKHIFIDNTGQVKDFLSNNITINLPKYIQSFLECNSPRCKYASKLPFCMGIYKNELLDIGGYDEDFIGWACDDDDLINRLLLNGLTYFYIDAKIIHLYHQKQYNKEEKMNNKDYLYNLKLFKEKRGIVVRNKGREWGIYNG